MTLSEKARALVEAAGKASKEPPSAVNDRRWLGINAMAIANAPDIAKAYLGLQEKAAELVRMLDACTPHIDGAFAFLANRVGSTPYDGPQYGPALGELRAWLERHESEGDGT